MKNNIPTVEEYFKSQIPKYHSVSEFMTDADIFYHVREFTKLHLTEALKAASELEECDGTQGYKIYPDQILSAYPLGNIK